MDEIGIFSAVKTRKYLHAEGNQIGMCVYEARTALCGNWWRVVTTRKGIIDFVMVEELSFPLRSLTRRENPYRLNKHSSTEFRTKWKVSTQPLAPSVFYKFSKYIGSKYKDTISPYWSYRRGVFYISHRQGNKFGLKKLLGLSPVRF